MKKFLFTVMMALPVSVVAANLGDGTKIQKIKLLDGFAVVWTVDPINMASCATQTNAFVLTLQDSDFGNRKYATLLTAAATGATFNPWCQDSCQSLWNQQFTKCDEAVIE